MGGSAGFEGKGRVSGALAHLRVLLAIPWIALTSGFLLGVLLLAPLFGVSRLLTARHADVVLPVVMGSVFVGLILGLGVLFGYWFVSAQGFIWFGPATVAGFIVALGVLSVRVGMQLLSKDSEG